MPTPTTPDPAPQPPAAALAVACRDCGSTAGTPDRPGGRPLRRAGYCNTCYCRRQRAGAIDTGQPTPGDVRRRPAPWERRPGHYIDPETLRYETHTTPHGRVLRQAKFYGDDRLAPCGPEPWEREHRPARPTRAAA
jgi:hypothetical protein